MTARPEGIEKIKPCGAVVKYNPCSRYARGSPCSYFDRWKKCAKPPLKCEMSEYDKWYKDVLTGKRKCFYPNRVRLLENPGVPMFVFHVHHHAIVGEAQIVRSTRKNGKHFYWFDKFFSYSHPVQFELLQTDPRLPRMGRRGRWTLVYISEETIEEIRSLSELPEGERKKLGKDLKRVMEQLKKRPLHAFRSPTWELQMRSECEKLKRNYKLNEQILAEVQKYFSESVRKQLLRGRLFDEMFYASLYLAFRMLKIPKLISDITEISGVSPKKLGKLYRLLVRELNLIVPPLDPEQLIISRSGRLEISKRAIKTAVSLVRETRRRSLMTSKAPSSVAAVATFVACQKKGEKRTKKQIAKLFNISDVTIRNYSRKIEALYDACAKGTAAS